MHSSSGKPCNNTGVVSVIYVKFLHIRMITYIQICYNTYSR